MDRLLLGLLPPHRLLQILLQLLLLCFLWISSVESSVHEYSNGRFFNQSNAFIYNGGSEGMHVSFNKSVGAYGSSYIRFESLTFRRTEQAAEKFSDMQARTQLIQGILLEVGDREKIGSRDDEKGTYALCCTRDLEEKEGCEVGEVIVHPVDGWPKTLSVYFKGNQLEATSSLDPVEITKSGMYNLYFIFCDPGLYGAQINGKTIWKNPTGYLPGRLTPMLNFYGFLSISYLILGLIWLVQYIWFWRDILQLQNYISLVIALGMCEMSLWYFDYTNFNSSGYRPAMITLWAVTFGAIRKTVSRCLLLIVSMGYGVVRPTLSGVKFKVLLLGTAYLLSTESFDVVEHVGAINDLAGKEKFLLVLPVAILDAVFIMWIFTSLSNTLEKLLVRKLTAKLDLYRNFTNTLAVSVVVSVAWIGYELFFKATNAFGQRWESEWIIGAFWNILGFVLLCVLCALWSPSRNSTRYAYSGEGLDEIDVEESITLTNPSAVADLDREKRFLHTELPHTEDSKPHIEKIE